MFILQALAILLAQADASATAVTLPQPTIKTTGIAVIRCKTLDTGRMSECQILSESPSGKGYGKAAVITTEANVKLRPSDIESTKSKGGYWTARFTFKQEE